MKSRILMTAAAIALALGIIGPGPCETDVADSIDPFEQARGYYITDGQTGVPISNYIVYDLGAPLDNPSINSSTVFLVRISDGDTVNSNDTLINGANLSDCSASSGNCPYGVAIKGGCLGECDLAPNTQYKLIINGVLEDDLTAVPYTEITFTTGAAPAGYTGTDCHTQVSTGQCPMVITGNTIDQTSGISGGIANDLSTRIDIVAAGIENISPYIGYTRVGDPLYILRLELWNQQIFAVGSPFDLSTTVKWINIRINGTDKKIYLPPYNYGGGIEPDQSLVLYIADDGSTYYATYEQLDSSDHTYKDNNNVIVNDPDQAYVSTYLAGDASGTGNPSTTPLIVSPTDLDETSGLNGGIIDGTTIWYDLAIYLHGVDSESYQGYASVTDSNANGMENISNFYGTIFFQYLYGTNIKVKSLFAAAYHTNLGGVATYVPAATLSSTPESWVLLLIQNKDSVSYPMGAGRVVTITDDGAATTVYLPNVTIPVGEALPLYVKANGSTYYAYDDGASGHTLDLVANNCSTSCPLIDPITSMTGNPAATAP